MDLSGLRRLRKLAPARPDGTYLGSELPMEEYLQADAVSSGLLKDVLARGTEYADTARRIVSEETDATIRGTAIHMAILEPHDFDRRYAPLSIECDLRTTPGRQEKAAIIASGRRAIKASVWEACLRLREKAWKNPVLAALLEQADTELTAFWTTDVGDVRGKARADVLARDARMILDLKSCEDASPREFAKTAASFGYHLSAPWYIDGFTAAGVPVDYWTIAALEANEDVGHYDVVLYSLDSEHVKRSRAAVVRALEAWNAAQTLGPALRHPGFVPLPIPEWAIPKELP